MYCSLVVWVDWKITCIGVGCSRLSIKKGEGYANHGGLAYISRFSFANYYNHRIEEGFISAGMLCSE